MKQAAYMVAADCVGIGKPRAPDVSSEALGGATVN